MAIYPSLLRPLAATVFALAMSNALAAPACIGATGPGAAAVDLYARMTARDDCVLHYIPAAGFDEIDSHGQRHHLDGSAFRQLFAGPAHIDFHADDVRTRINGNEAIVTGVRVGGVTVAGVPAHDEQAAFTMIWRRNGQGWQLLHVHLSTIAADSP